jgi:hypothetical protein
VEATVDPVPLIVAALAAGAAPGVVGRSDGDDTKEAVKSAYAKLRELAERRLSDSSGSYVLEKYGNSPEIWEAPLAAELDSANAAADADLVTAARSFMKIIEGANRSARPAGGAEQLGLLDLSVDLSVPEVYSGSDFTLYLHVKNPFARPVWINSVELSLPTQLSTREAADPSDSRKSAVDVSSDEFSFVRSRVQQYEADLRQLRDSISTDNHTSDARGQLERKAAALEDRIRELMGLLSGRSVIHVGDGSDVWVGRARVRDLIVHVNGGSSARFDDLRGPTAGDTERVPLVGSLPKGAALQPGSTDVWTIRLGSNRTPFFIPAKYKLQLTVVYGLEKASNREVGASIDLYSNTCSYSLQVRAALWSVILGGVVGGIIGSFARSLQVGGKATAFDVNLTIGALLLSAILSGAAIIFSARKAEAQSFVTVEDFWGGLLIGFLIGYSGTTAFAKITGS